MAKALKIEHWPIGRVHAYAKNARLHDDAQIALIAASIKEFGFVNPALVDAKGVLAAGHGRILAAKSLGLKTVPVIKLGHLSAAQVRAYRLADNKIPMGATWDDALLKIELQELEVLGFDLAITGFDLADFGSPSGVDPEETPEPPKVPTTRRGDVWLCGKHRVMCGDATVAEDVASALGGAKPNLIVTDPPYGVSYDPGWRVDRSLSQARRGKVANDDRDDWREAWAHFSGAIAYVWHAGLHARQVVESLEASGFLMRAQIIWNKGHIVISRGHYHFQHEPCWYAVRKGATAAWHGDHKQSTVWDIPKPSASDTGHGTQKPVECMARPIRNNSKKGEAVYDPFLGSGTTMIAAEMENRVCLGIDIDPIYVDVAIMRFGNFVGDMSAIRLSIDGKEIPFEEMRAMRSGKRTKRVLPKQDARTDRSLG